MGCGERTLNPKSNSTLQNVLVICYFTGRCAGSLSQALFLCIIKRRNPLLTSRSVGDRRVNWHRQLVEWHFGHHKSHTHRSRIDPALCMHCSITLCCSTAPYNTCDICLFCSSTILLYHMNTLNTTRIPWAVRFCVGELPCLLVPPLQEVPDVVRTKLLLRWV